MEPLLELADRITAHLWMFHECCPGADRLEQFLANTAKLQALAANDYSTLQLVMDLADYSEPGYADPEDPLPQFRLKDEKGAEESLYYPPPRQRRSRDLLIRRQQQVGELREIASSEALNVLTARLELLQKLGMQFLFERILDFWEEEGQSSPAAKPEEIDKPIVWTSDGLFEWVARWLSRKGFASRDRERLAEAFLILQKRGRYGEGRYDPKLDSRLKQVPTRFLLEANLDGRARAILKRFSAHGWLNRFRGLRLRLRKRRLLKDLSAAGEASLNIAAQLRHHNAKLRLQKTEHDEKLRRAAEQWLKRSAPSRLKILLNRSKLRMLCELIEAQVPFSLAFSDELDEIRRSRMKRLYADPNQDCRASSAEDEPPNLNSEDNAVDSSGTKGTSVRGMKDAAASAVSERSGLSTEQAFKSRLLGVALSGGGIRSATFALGVLQGMADRNILPYIDAISSVSGGGYIASWLVAWTKRRGSIHAVQNSLRGFASPIQCSSAAAEADKGGVSFQFLSRNQDPRGDHLRPVRLLREYSRYLAPEEGFLSADSWTIASTWLRNTLLNLTILMLLFGGVLLLPRMVIFFLFHTQVWFHPGLLDSKGSLLTYFHVFLVTFLAGLPFLLICWVLGSRNLRVFGAPIQGRNAVARGFDDGEVLGQIVVPLLLGGLLEVAAIWNFATTGSPKSTAAGFVTIALLGIGILSYRATDAATQVATLERHLIRLLILVGSGLINFGMVYEFCSILDKFGMNTQRGLWTAGTFGPPLLIVVVGTTIVGLLGLSGTLLSEEQREWWSRLGAWITMATLGWIAICLICFYMPLWIAMAGIKIAAAGVAWGAVTAAGVKLAFSAKSGDPSSGAIQPRWKTWLLSAAPIVFVVGLLSFASMMAFWGMNLLIDRMLNPPEWLKWLARLHWVNWIRSLFPSLVDDRAAHQLCCTNLPITLNRIVAYYWPLMHGESIAPLLLATCLLGICFIFTWRVDINEFSMHHFYRNRLVRAYLGASRERPHRLPNAFTGFDLEDDIRLHRFLLDDPTQVRDMVMDCKASYIGPFLIVNTTLNVTKGQDLGIQQRRAESFFFSPIWSGFDYSRKQTRVKTSALSEFGFRRTREFGTGAAGASLGTAMAISGAAFNSNAGFHTSAPLAFLLTVFGVRLGWWAGNPRWDKWAENSPMLGLGYLINELTANTTTEKNFVLLTDGGHFENMGLYELVRRRCRYIVVSDAEEDEQFKLEGIGGAVRKCRNDFGVVITLNLEALEPLGKPAKSRLHYSIGTIRYPGETECGTLVYIKSSLTNDESVDLIEFGKRHQEFPHTSTVNQFFDESHFESYRELGHHVASGIFQHNMPKTPLAQGNDSCKFVGDMFKALEDDFKKALANAEKKDKAIPVKLADEVDHDE